MRLASDQIDEINSSVHLLALQQYFLHALNLIRLSPFLNSDRLDENMLDPLNHIPSHTCIRYSGSLECEALESAYQERDVRSTGSSREAENTQINGQIAKGEDNEEPIDA